MTKSEINQFIESFADKKDRVIVIVDYGNVEKWKNGLNWKVGIKELGQLIKHFSLGKKFLRRFYYGSDYGKNEKSKNLVGWSKSVLDRAGMNNFDIITKRVKYIHDCTNGSKFTKKCDLDVEMSIDLVKEKDNYDTIILFSGDGDLMYAVQYLYEKYPKRVLCFWCQRSCWSRSL